MLLLIINEYNNYKKKKISLNKNLLQIFIQSKLLGFKIMSVYSILRKIKRVYREVNNNNNDNNISCPLWLFIPQTTSFISISQIPFSKKFI